MIEKSTGRRLEHIFFVSLLVAFRHHVIMASLGGAEDPWLTCFLVVEMRLMFMEGTTQAELR